MVAWRGDEEFPGAWNDAVHRAEVSGESQEILGPAWEGLGQ